jgi:hypothetical protein
MRDGPRLIAPGQSSRGRWPIYARNSAEGVPADQTLSAILGRGDHPNWIVPVDLSASSLSLYRVVR